MDDEEIGREILRVLGSSPSPLKPHDIRMKIRGRCSRQDVNRVLYKKEHLEVERANPGMTPPLWKLKVTQPAALNPGLPPSQLPHQQWGAAPSSVTSHQQGGVPPYLQGGMAPYPHQQGGVTPYLHQQGGVAPYSVSPHQQGGVAPYLHQQGGAAPSSVSPHQPQSGAIPPVLGGVVSSPPPSLIGGVAPSPPQSLVEGMASNNSTPPSGQMYKRRNYRDGSLLFEPVDTPPSSSVPSHAQVTPGRMTSSPSHMTEGRDVMPGHVTCSPVEETHASSREQQPPQMNLDGSTSCNQQLNNLQSPAPAREFPSEGGNFPGMSCSHAANLTGKVECMDPSNFANSAKKDFPAKDGAAKNFKVSSQLDCVINNATPPPSSATPPSPSSSSPSPSSSSAKSKKKKKTAIAAKFPSPSTANPALNPNPRLPSTTTSPPSSAASQSPAVLPLLDSSMQSLRIDSQLDIKERVYCALKERELDSTELARLIGMEGRMEELMQSLMKLLEEGRAMKRIEKGKKYWKICDGKKKS